MNSAVINIAIVEDEPAAARAIQSILNTYSQENNVIFNAKYYGNAVSFLTDNKASYDIAFMDIGLPDMNGMEAAFKLRAVDKRVIIIFVTNMAQYAARGYEVDALYYIMKPVNYQNTAYKLKRALSLIAANTEAEIVLPRTNGFVRISSQRLMYVEIIGHKLLYHAEDQTYTAYGTLADAEQKLRPHHFFRCNNCYLVKASFIQSISGFTITLFNNEQLQISHPKKKQFMLDMANWLGEGNV